MTTDFGEAQNDASSAYWHCPPSYGLASRRRPIARDPIQRCAAAGAPERGYLECGSTIVDLHSTWPLAVVSLGGIVDRGPAVAADRGRTGNFLLFSDDDAFTRPPSANVAEVPAWPAGWPNRQTSRSTWPRRARHCPRAPGRAPTASTKPASTPAGLLSSEAASGHPAASARPGTERASAVLTTATKVHRRASSCPDWVGFGSR